MAINKNNYQEFLLLFIDGELNENLSKEVEVLIEQNAEIKNEFNVLLDTKLMQDEVSFGDISCLLKTEKNGINLKNYEEKFLLFVDEELAPKEKKEVEKFVLQNPNLQADFIAIKKAKLPLAIIDCPQKAKLYKKERNPIIFYVQRLAIAAVFIGLIAFVWNIVGSNKKENIIVKTNENKLKSGTPIYTENNIKNNDINNGSQNHTTPNFLIKKENKTITEKNKIAVEKQYQKQTITTENIALNNININNKPLPTNVDNTAKKTLPDINANKEIATENKSNLPVNNVAENNKNIATNPKENNALIANNTLVNNKNVIPTKTIYKTLDTDNEEDKTILVANTAISKTKVQGLLNKFTKIFTKKKAINDDASNSSYIVL